MRDLVWEANTPAGSTVVTGTAGVVLAENSDRQYFRISNPSTVIVWIALGGTATAVPTKGVALNPGEYFEFPYTNYQGPISAVLATPVGVTITFVEV